MWSRGSHSPPHRPHLSPRRVTSGITLFYEPKAYILLHYHGRSNAESVFGAIKKKLGEALKSRKPVAQVNELLCKVLAYNITVLIHEMYEHGVVPGFAPKAASAVAV